jgi:hypothetical protein
MRKVFIGFARSAMLFALYSLVDAQQPKKVPLIGLLDSGTISASAGRIEAFREGVAPIGLR